jgi:hypothetical protein
MKLNRAELKKIIYDFNSTANRLMKADYQEYNSILAKFLAFIERETLIAEYIRGCGAATLDVAADVKEVAGSYGHSYFELGDTPEEENASVYQILRYSVDNDIEIARTIAMAYAGGSKKWQDMVKGFNERVVLVLIRNIEGYLTKIGIDMGIDDTARYNITVTNGQVNLASDNAVINATVNNGVNQQELQTLLDKLMNMSKAELDAEDFETVSKSVEIIHHELTQEKPKKSVLRGILATLQGIKGTAEFAAAVVTLIQFIRPIIGLDK